MVILCETQSLVKLEGDFEPQIESLGRVGVWVRGDGGSHWRTPANSARLGCQDVEALPQLLGQDSSAFCDQQAATTPFTPLAMDLLSTVRKEGSRYVSSSS